MSTEKKTKDIGQSYGIVMCKKAHAWLKHHVLAHVTLSPFQFQRIPVVNPMFYKQITWFNSSNQNKNAIELLK